MKIEFEKLPKAVFEKINKKKAAKAALWFCVFFLLCSMISRGIYAAALPRVKTELPAYINLTHQVKAEGKLVADKENAVYGLDGLRVERIFVEEGEKVEQGQDLLQYDLEDLKEIIEKKEIELKKLEIQIDTLRYNQGVEKETKDRQAARAKEDYAKTQSNAQTEGAWAQNDLNKARQELADFPSKEAYIEAHGGVPGTVSANELEEQWQQQKNALEQAVESSRRAADGTLRQNEDALNAAKRSLEDAAARQLKDSSPELLELEKEVMEKEIALYKSVEEAGGILTSGYQGAVTKIVIEESGRVSDGALLFVADSSEGWKFQARIGKEDRKYVTVGDQADLSIGTDKERVSGKILSLEEDSEGETYTLLVKVDESAGNLGDTGTVTISKQEGERSVCVPLAALHQRESVKYVLVYEERQTILGSELVAVERIVDVTDSNEHYASIADGFLSESGPVIISATKPVEEGDTIRLMQP